MKRKELLKKALIYSIIGATVAGNTVPAYAYTNSMGSVDETQNVSENTSAECEVYATLASSFKVTIPKKITLDGGTKKGSYTVDVEGDIGGTDVIKVVPDPSVALNSTNLASVTASISQDKTEWSYNEILTDSKVAGNGSIDASGITAGAWNGTFNFNVEYESAESETPVTLEAGLYDANGVMLCSWEDSGIDVEKDYSGTSGDENYYQTATTSGYYVLTNNYPDATKVVIPDSVTSIGDCAFYECTNLTSITISANITSIGEKQFRFCPNLDNIDVDKNNTAYCSVDGVLFNEDMTSLIRYPAGKTNSVYIVPDGVVNIEDYAFESCINLVSVVLPDGLINIGNFAFNTCSNLSNVSIPTTVANIGDTSFHNCVSLTDIIIPEGVTSISVSN